MPSLSSRLRSKIAEERGAVKAPSTPPRPPLPPAQPVLSTTLRTPLPNLVVTQPDSLRQYYVGGVIPQYRFPPLKPLSN